MYNPRIYNLVYSNRTHRKGFKINGVTTCDEVRKRYPTLSWKLFLFLEED